jgi:hypothetical protein
MHKQPFIQLVDQLEYLTDGTIDIIPFGRPFAQGSEWVAHLYRSLCRKPQLPIGTHTLWDPPNSDRPTAGRYRAETTARWFIIDGQQRATALAGGLGLRPAYLPESIWEEIGGPALAVALVLESPTAIHVRPLRDDRYKKGMPRIQLGDLIVPEEVDIAQLVADAGAATDAREANSFSAVLGELRNRVRATNISMAWVDGGVEDAAEAYRLHTGKGSYLISPASEMQTVILALRAPGIRRDLLDPLIQAAQAAGFAKVVTTSSINKIIQMQLPPAHRKLQAVTAPPEVIRTAVERTNAACRGVIAYLQAHGIIDGSLLSLPGAIHVLMHLAARFPQALQDDFVRRWLVHALVSNRHHAQDKGPREDMRAVLTALDYPAARRALARRAPSGPPTPLTVDNLHSGARGRFAEIKTLYAMAMASPSGLPIRDLSDPDVVFPYGDFSLVRLWAGELQHSFADYILATPATAEVLEQHGGWNRAAYEALRGRFIWGDQ